MKRHTSGCEVFSHWALIENGNPLQYACLWTEEYGGLQSMGSELNMTEQLTLDFLN